MAMPTFIKKKIEASKDSSSSSDSTEDSASAADSSSSSAAPAKKGKDAAGDKNPLALWAAKRC